MMLTLFETSCILLLLFIYLFILNFLFIIYPFLQKLKENEFLSKDLEQLKNNNNDNDNLSTLDEFEVY